MSDSNNNTHPHPHFAAEPVEVSQYTYDATTKPSTEASHTLISKDSTQHRSGSPVEPTASRIHPVGVFSHDKEHPKHDDKQHDAQHPRDQHAKHTTHSSHSEPHPQPETHKPIPHIEPHATSHSSPHQNLSSKHPQAPEPTHQHPQDHPASSANTKPHATSTSTTHTHDYAPTSPSSTISSDSVQTPISPVFGNAERRQSWSKDEMKRGVMQGLLEKGKGKQAKGGYSSVNTGE